MSQGRALSVEAKRALGLVEANVIPHDALLGAVSEEDRILLTLKEVEGLSLKELEGIYHVNENALKVRLFRARQRVLKSLGGAEGDPAASKGEG